MLLFRFYKTLDSLKLKACGSKVKERGCFEFGRKMAEKGGTIANSIFFSRSVSSNIFKKFLLKVVNSFPNKPWILRVCSSSLLKTLWEKEKLLVTSNFSFSHSIFYPFGKLSTIKFEIVVCKLFQFEV